MEKSMKKEKIKILKVNLYFKDIFKWKNKYNKIILKDFKKLNNKNLFRLLNFIN